MCYLLFFCYLFYVYCYNLDYIVENEGKMEKLEFMKNEKNTRKGDRSLQIIWNIHTSFPFCIVFVDTGFAHTSFAVILYVVRTLSKGGSIRPFNLSAIYWRFIKLCCDRALAIIYSYVTVGSIANSGCT